MSTIALLLVLLSLAVGTDARWHRIPNWVTVGGLISALVLSFVDHGPVGLLHGLAGAAIGGAILLPLNLKGGMGAGDVKLMAAAGAALGPGGAALAALLALIAGAVIAGGYLVVARDRAVRRFERQRDDIASRRVHASGARAAAREERFPYACAIATGVILELWRSGAFARLLVDLS